MFDSTVVRAHVSAAGAKGGRKVGKRLASAASSPSSRRARIEQAVGKIKRFERIALRCRKTKRNFASFLALAAGFILIKPVHIA